MKLNEIDTVGLLNSLDENTNKEIQPVKKERIKKPKPVIRERKRRPKKGMEIRSKKVIREEVDHYGSNFIIHFPEELKEKYEPELLKINGLLPHRFHPRIPFNPDGSIPEEEIKVWLAQYQVRASDETLQLIAAFGKTNRFEFDSDIAVRAQMATSDGKELEKLSYATSFKGIEFPKYKWFMFGKDPATKKQLKPNPFQLAAPAYVLKTKKAFIADEMGLGKTIEAILCIAADKANIRNDGLQEPWLIITPASLRINWFKEVRKWLPKKITTTMMRNKFIKTRTVTNKKTKQTRTVLTKETKEYLEHHQIFIMTYDKIHRYGEALKTLPWRGVICDESHYLKGRNSKRMIAVRNWIHEMDPEYVLLLSGTPLMNRPLDLLSQLQILKRLNDFGGYNHFMTRYCTMSTTEMSHVSRVHEALKKGATEEEIEDIAGTMNKSKNTTEDLLREAADEKQRKLYQNMIALNKSLRSLCFIRREKKDVLKDLPEKTRQTLVFEITNRKDYEAIEADVIGFLMDKVAKDEKFLASIKKFSREKQQALVAQRRAEKAASGERAEALQRIEALKQAAAVGKMKAVKEWIDNFLESGKKLVVAATHNIILNELEAMYPDNSVSIRSNMSPERRNESVEAFQGDKKVKLIFIGLKMAEGLTLTAASDTLTIEFGWNPAKHDQFEDRVHRIGQKENVVAYYAVARNTIEEKIGRLIEKKRRVVNAVADGDPLKDSDTGSVLGELLGELTGGLHLYA